MSRLFKIVFVAMALFVLQPLSTSLANFYTVTPGVEYKKGANRWNNKAQTIHTVEVDVNRSDVTVDAIIPNPLSARTRLTNLLQMNSSEGNRLVAGVNASFFHTSSNDPAYLLSSNGIVNTYGVISSGNDEYMSVPTAFGIGGDGKGILGKFDYEATVTIGDVETKITSVNKERESNEVILYTPSYSYDSTRASKYGIEFTISDFSSSIEKNYKLGQQVVAKVSAITPYESRDSKIPKNGAVISIHGGAQAEKFKDVKVGDEVSLTIDLKAPWKDADFVLASGPLLVQNGKVDMTIDRRSARATAVHPRTAVAINKDGSKVFLVTVDGRRAGSTGMNLTEFSEYLVSIGAHAALNLDGGGSTTMAVRERGDLYPSLFNRPSDNYERAISAALGAVSLTTTGPAASIEIKLNGPSTLSVGERTSLDVVSGLDNYFNPVSIKQNDITYVVEGGIGIINDKGQFTATKEGKGGIVAQLGNAKKSYPIEVIDEPVEIITGGKLLHSFEHAGEWEAASINAATTIRFDGSRAPVKDGKTSLTLSYDFTKYKEGTSASYAALKKPLQMKGKPTYLGLWVYGDGASHWLRGQIIDRQGQAHTIDFTKNSGLNWKGWKYVKAKIPTDIIGSVSLSRIYIAETNSMKKNKGSIYLDRLVAEYGDDYKEPLFNDVPLNHRAAEDIAYAVDKGWILGDLNGTFNPENSISRAHAAVLISRVHNLSSNNHTTFTDVPSTHRYSKEIAAVVEAGIMSGKNARTFDPSGSLTRAQMAKILVNSYGLTADPAQYDLLKDVPKTHWAFDDIHVLRKNRVTIINDGYYRPFDDVKRYQIAAFLTRIDQNQ